MGFQFSVARRPVFWSLFTIAVVATATFSVILPTVDCRCLGSHCAVKTGFRKRYRVCDESLQGVPGGSVLISTPPRSLEIPNAQALRP